MFSLSSTTLALKGKLIKPSTITAFLLLVVFILTLYIAPCGARHPRVHGKDDYSSKLPSSPPKGRIHAKEKTGSSPEVAAGSNMDASMGDEAVTKAKKKEVASSGDSCRGSLRERLDRIKVMRSSLRERSVLGVDLNNEQVGSNATSAYTAEALVAMDYLDAHPPPAVHNR